MTTTKKLLISQLIGLYFLAPVQLFFTITEIYHGDPFRAIFCLSAFLLVAWSSWSSLCHQKYFKKEMDIHNRHAHPGTRIVLCMVGPEDEILSWLCCSEVLRPDQPCEKCGLVCPLDFQPK